MKLERSLVYILMQELFENDLFEIEDLTNKYSLNKEQIKELDSIYNELYGEDDRSEMPWDYGKHFD